MQKERARPSATGAAAHRKNSRGRVPVYQVMGSVLLPRVLLPSVLVPSAPTPVAGPASPRLALGGLPPALGEVGRVDGVGARQALRGALAREQRQLWRRGVAVVLQSRVPRAAAAHRAWSG